MATPAVNYYLRKRQLDRRTRVGFMTKTTTFPIGSQITGDPMSEYYEQPTSWAFRMSRSVAEPTGCIFHMGVATRGILCVVSGANMDMGIEVGGATAGTNKLIVVPKIFDAIGDTVSVVLAISPNTGEIRVWKNGQLASRTETDDGNMGGGWAATGEPYGVGDGFATLYKPTLSSLATTLTGATIHEFDFYGGQLPRGFA